MKDTQERIFAINEYISGEAYPEMDLFIYRWSDKTLAMSNEEYKASLLQTLDIVLRLQPKYVIANWRLSEFSVVPELQSWVVEHIVLPAAREGGVQRAFHVLRQDMIQELMFEQLSEEEAAQALLNKGYFASEEDVFRWIQAMPQTEMEVSLAASSDDEESTNT